MKLRTTRLCPGDLRMKKERKTRHPLDRGAGQCFNWNRGPALHGRGGIKESTRHRILQVARQIGYTPNLAARALSVARASASVGVCMPREIHFFYDQLWSGVLEESRRVAQLGISFINRPVQVLGEGDTEAFTELCESGVSGIILTAGNPKGLTPLIDQAEEKGIRVLCVSTDAPDSQRSSIVCVEPRLNGCLAGELMGKFVPPGSQVAVVAGMLNTEDHRKKTDGFSEAFPQHCAGGKIFTVIEGHEDEDESFQKTFELLRQAPESCRTLCEYRELSSGVPGARSPRPCRKSEINHHRSFRRDGPLFSTRHHHGFDLSAAPPPGPDGRTTDGGSPHQQGSPSRLPSISVPGVVMSSNLNLFREMRITEFRFDTGSDPRARRFIAWFLSKSIICYLVASWYRTT